MILTRLMQRNIRIQIMILRVPGFLLISLHKGIDLIKCIKLRLLVGERSAHQKDVVGKT